MIVTQRIKQILKSKGWTQQDMADKLGTSLQNVKITLNSQSMTTKNVERYAEILGVPIWQLFVSPDEVQPVSGGARATCPHCGKPISVEVNLK